MVLLLVTAKTIFSEIANQINVDVKYFCFYYNSHVANILIMVRFFSHIDFLSYRLNLNIPQRDN